MKRDNKKEALMKQARAENDKTKKPYKIPSDRIENLIEPMGGCFATDRILVDGCRVGYMYREPPDFEEDSGWRFMSGDETEEYIDDQWYSGIYAVNTICNYDREIVEFLNAPVGSAFGRDKDGELKEIEE